jgi:hypothetical protein
MWIRLQLQLYTYKAWDREEQKVVDVIDSPYFEYPTHYFPPKRRSINCSAGPYRKKPCFPCAAESIYWDDFREKEEEVRKMGLDVKIEKRTAMAVTGVDRYFEVPLTDNKGVIRKNARGEVIKRFVAEPLADFGEGVQFPVKMGHNMHWSFSNRHLSQLERFNDLLGGVCANCCTNMHASQLVCADCGQVEQSFDSPIDDLEDIRQLRAEDIRCNACNSEDVVPILNCTGCGDPAEGGIMDFDLRLKQEPVDDRNTDLVLTGWRLPDYNEELIQLYQNPLNIEEILCPTPLNIQKTILGDLANGLDPSAGAFTENYDGDSSSGDGGNSDTSDDDIPF